MIGKIFETLAGGPVTEYSVDPATGKTVATQRDQRPGEEFDHIFAGILTGLAAGARERGPGAGLRSLGAGFEAESQEKKTEDARKQGMAEQEFQNQNTADEMTMRKAADARAQLQSIRDGQLFDMNMKVYSQELASNDFKHSKDVADYLQSQLDRKNADAVVGVKPFAIGGKEVPGFASLEEAENFAHGHAQDVIAGFKTQLRYDPGTKEYKIVEVPDTGPQWYDVKDADGKAQRIFGRPADVLTWQDRVADIKNKTSETARNYQEAKDRLDARAKDAAYEKALKELDDNDGDYSKLSPSSREVLTANAVKNFNTVQSALEKSQAADDQDSVKQLAPLRNQYAAELGALQGKPVAKPEAPAPLSPDAQKIVAQAQQVAQSAAVQKQVQANKDLPQWVDGQAQAFLKSSGDPTKAILTVNQLIQEGKIPADKGSMIISSIQQNVDFQKKFNEQLDKARTQLIY